MADAPDPYQRSGRWIMDLVYDCIISNYKQGLMRSTSADSVRILTQAD